MRRIRSYSITTKTLFYPHNTKLGNYLVNESIELIRMTSTNNCTL